MPNNPDDDGCATAQPDECLSRARALLVESLQIIDCAGLPGRIGARLQHVIDDLDLSTR
jgi:hypothetical protein